MIRGHEVERERAILDRPVARPAGVERDPLLHEDRVAAAAGRGQGLGPERLQRLHERARVRARLPVGIDQLVVEVTVQGRQGPCILVSRATPASPTVAAWTSEYNAIVHQGDERRAERD